MKIITEDKVYVQRIDLGRLEDVEDTLPAAVYLPFWAPNLNGPNFVSIDDTNRFEFFDFDTPEAIEYFKDIDWILDYTTISVLSKDELEEVGQGFLQARNKLAEEYQGLTGPIEGRRAEIVEEVNNIDYKIATLQYMYAVNTGKEQLVLPPEIAPPETKVTESKKPYSLLQRLKNHFKTNKQ